MVLSLALSERVRTGDRARAGDAKSNIGVKWSYEVKCSMLARCYCDSNNSQTLTNLAMDGNRSECLENPTVILSSKLPVTTMYRSSSHKLSKYVCRKKCIPLSISWYRKR